MNVFSLYFNSPELVFDCMLVCANACSVCCHRWSHLTHVSAQQVTNWLCKTLTFCFQRNCPITWTQQAEQQQWNMLSGWECVRRCYFSLACFQRRSVETHCGQADSLLIQDRRHVSDGLYLRCHIPSPRQWITPFTAQTGFDVPEQTFTPSASKLLSGWMLPTLNLYIYVFPSLPSSLQTSNESRRACKCVWQRKGMGLWSIITINNLRACKVSF